MIAGREPEARARLAAPVRRPHAHQALLRQVTAEAEHVPDEVVRAWWQAGPVRVRTELAARLRRRHERGLLRVDDADAPPSTSPTSSPRATPPGLGRLGADEHDAWVSAGVRAFLGGYRPRDDHGRDVVSPPA